MSASTFVGRRDELRVLDAAWRAGRIAPPAGVAIVSADPGFGKTALIEEFLRGLDPTVERFRASPLQVETDTSWSTLRMLVASWLDDTLPPAVAVAVGRAPASAAPPAGADVAFAFAEALRERAAPHPLVVIDDLQWVDRASAAAIAAAMRSADVFWLVGQRAGTDTTVDIERIAGAAAVTTVTLAPLRRAEIGELVTTLFGGRWSPPVLTYVAEISEGQPLHAIELARELSTAPTPSAPARGARPLAAMYGERLDALDPVAREIVALAALAVHPTFDLMERLRPDADLESVLDTLERQGLVRLGLGSIDFTHALARRAVTERLGGVERARFHRELAEHVDDRERRAVHLGHGATRPDHAVADQLHAAAELAVARGATYRLQGETSAEQVAYEALGRLHQPAARGRIQRTLVRLHQFNDLRRALVTATDAVADARRTGDRSEQLAAEAALANVRFLLGEQVDLDDLIRRLELEGAAASSGQSATSFLQEMVAWDDRFDTARRFTDELMAIGRSNGSLTTVVNALGQAATFELRAGNVATARKLVDEVLDILAPRRGADLFNASEDVIVLAALAGEHDEAAALIHEIEAEVDEIGPTMQIAFRAHAGFAELTAGRPEHALGHLGRAWELADLVGFRDVRSVGFQSDFAEALLLTGDVSRAGAVVGFLGEAASRSGSVLVRTEHLRCRGLLHATSSDGDAALTDLEAAAALAPATGRPLTIARTLLALGAALRKQGARSRAREILHEARRIFEQLDAPPWTARVDDELARLGVRTKAASTRTLSPTERRIAELVTMGRSNREIAAELIVSLRTVESNLTRVYRKLGVRGRTELAAGGATLLADV